MNVAAIDLNLLLVFDTLFSERSVTRAAAKIGLSQPALSNALSRLRVQLGDRLFIRGTKGMIPTPRALELAPEIQAGLHHLRNALQRPEFNLETATIGFRLATTDEIELLILPTLARRLDALAPGVSVNCHRLAGIFRLPLNELQSGAFDFAVSSFPHPALESGLFSLNLYRERYLCIARKGSPSASRKLTLSAFCSARHVATFYPGSGPGLIDRLLEERGHKRQVKVTLPHWLSVPAIIAQSDMIATVPERVARNAELSLPIICMKCPVAIPAFQVSLVWHARTHESAAHRWFRSLVRQVAAGRK
jgi:DNA-binding transcriptional LysR family regulator